MLSVMGLIPTPPGKIVAGKAIFQGNDLLRASEEELRKVRGGKIGMIFQDPMTSLNPVLTIERQITESVEEHKHLSQSDARKRAVELLDLVGMPNPEKQLKAYPHEFSGGMRQRVMIAIALACNPPLLIADEPTTALDVTVQAQILRLVKNLRDTLGMAIIWISHDLAVVAGLVDRVIVMYGGFIVEEARIEDLFANPTHPYTLGLMGSIPGEEMNIRSQRLVSIPGAPPILHERPTYCPFAIRCPYVIARCCEANPPLFSIGSGHKAACWVNIAEKRIRS